MPEYISVTNMPTLNCLQVRHTSMMMLSSMRIISEKDGRMLGFCFLNQDTQTLTNVYIISHTPCASTAVEAPLANRS